MRKINWMPVLGLAFALGLGSCSASDDELGGSTLGEQTMSPSFSLLNYSQSESTPISQNGGNREGMDEKLTCKILPNGKLMMTHKNVVFDDATAIRIETTLKGNRLYVTEMGEYGQSGNYGYYTLVATVGTLKDGDYTIIVRRNNNVRAEFKMTYDSSKVR